jgi:hypothetical protein
MRQESQAFYLAAWWRASLVESDFGQRGTQGWDSLNGVFV